MGDEAARMMADLGQDHRNAVAAPMADHRGKPMRDRPVNAVTHIEANRKIDSRIAHWSDTSQFSRDEISEQQPNYYDGQGHRAALRRALDSNNSRDDDVESRFGEERALHLREQAATSGGSDSASRTSRISAHGAVIPKGAQAYMYPPARQAPFAPGNAPKPPRAIKGLEAARREREDHAASAAGSSSSKMNEMNRKRQINDQKREAVRGSQASNAWLDFASSSGNGSKKAVNTAAPIVQVSSSSSAGIGSSSSNTNKSGNGAIKPTDFAIPPAEEASTTATKPLPPHLRKMAKNSQPPFNPASSGSLGESVESKIVWFQALNHASNPGPAATLWLAKDPSRKAIHDKAKDLLISEALNNAQLPEDDNVVKEYYKLHENRKWMFPIAQEAIHLFGLETAETQKFREQGLVHARVLFGANAMLGASKGKDKAAVKEEMPTAATPKLGSHGLKSKTAIANENRKPGVKVVGKTEGGASAIGRQGSSPLRKEFTADLPSTPKIADPITNTYIFPRTTYTSPGGSPSPPKLDWAGSSINATSEDYKDSFKSSGLLRGPPRFYDMPPQRGILDATEEESIQELSPKLVLGKEEDKDEDDGVEEARYDNLSAFDHEDSSASQIGYRANNGPQSSAEAGESSNQAELISVAANTASSPVGGGHHPALSASAPAFNPGNTVTSAHPDSGIIATTEINRTVTPNVANTRIGTVSSAVMPNGNQKGKVIIEIESTPPSAFDRVRTYLIDTAVTMTVKIVPNEPNMSIDRLLGQLDMVVGLQHNMQDGSAAAGSTGFFSK